MISLDCLRQTGAVPCGASQTKEMTKTRDDDNYFTRKREIGEAFEGLQLKEDKTELDRNLLKSLGFLVKQYDTS